MDVDWKTRGERLLHDGKLALRRLAHPDVDEGEPAEWERLALERHGVRLEEPVVPAFLTWRRSLLWLATFFLSLSGLVKIVTYEPVKEQVEQGAAEEAGLAWEELVRAERIDARALPKERFVENSVQESIKAIGPGNLTTLSNLMVLLLLSQIAAAILLGWSAWKWFDPLRSRRFGLAAWGTAFLFPFLVMLLPITGMMNFSHIAEASDREKVVAALGTILGIGYFVTLLPKVVSLFPALLRAAMVLKHLLPQSAAPGWTSLAVAPFYALFLLLIVVAVNQTNPSFWIVLATLCFLAASLVTVYHSREFLNPHTPEEARRLLPRIRRDATVMNAAGLLFLLPFFFTQDMFGFGDVLELAITLVAHLLLNTVIASDVLLPLLAAAQKRGQRFLATEHEHELRERYAALRGAGLTDSPF